MPRDLFSVSVDENLSLALLTPEWAKELFALTDANRKHLAAWLPWLDGVTEVAHSKDYIARSLKEAGEQIDMSLGIVAGEDLAGIISLMDIRLDQGTAEIGYWLGKDFEGQGLVTRSCRWLLAYGFDTLGLERIVLECEPKNQRSRKIPRRLGFTLEGTQRSAREQNGRRIDLELYSLLKEEYEAGAVT